MSRCFLTKMFKTDSKKAYTGHLMNEEVLCRMNMQRLHDIAAERQLRYTKHVLSISEDRHEKGALK